MHAPDIKCPYCGNQMIPGTTYIRGTILGFLMVGFSSQHLWFRSSEAKKLVLESGEQRAGHRCPQCGAVTVYPLTREWGS